MDGGHLAWAKRAGGGGYDGPAGIGVLADGSWLIAGKYSSAAAVFGPGEANEITLPPSPYGEYDMFLARYRADGSLAWARRAGGGPTFQDDIPHDLVVRADGSSIMCGSYEGTTTFDGDAQDITITTSGNGAFLAGFDVNGSVLWAFDALGGQLAASPDGTLTMARNLSIARHTSSGSHVWTKTVVSDAYASISDVAMLADGSVLITGEFAGTATFGSGESNPVTLTAPGTFGWQADAFIAKLAADGSVVWARVAATNPLEVQPGAIAALADGSFVITGFFGGHYESANNGNGTATFGPGQVTATMVNHQALDLFVARFDANGAFQWVRTGKSTGHEFGTGIAAAPDGSSIAVTGWFGIYNGSTMTLGDQPNQILLLAQGMADSFVASFTGNGDLRWAKRVGGTGRTEASRIEMFADGSTLFAGAFGGDATFGPGEPATVTLTAQGNADPFAAKLGP